VPAVDLEAGLATEQLRQFCQVDQRLSLLFHALSVTGAIAVATLAQVSGGTSPALAALWIAAVWSAEGATTAVNWSVARRRPQGWAVRPYAQAKTVTTTAQGAAWSSGLWLLAVPGAPITTLAPAWGVIMVAAGAMYACAAYPPCMHLMLAALLVPAWARALTHGGGFEAAIGLCLLTAWPFAHAIGAMAVATMRRTLLGRLEIAHLLARETVLAEQLRQANAERTRFFGAASHDLRQPLQALGFYVSLLEADRLDPGHADLVRRLAECAAQLDRQFNAILGVAQSDAVIDAARVQPVALQGVFERVLASVRPEAALKRLSLRVVPTSLWVAAAPNVLERVLVNLLTNAVRYTRQGKILLGVRRRGALAELWVADTGIGIAPDQQARIFEAFYQVGNPGRAQDQGFGLGLAIVKRLADGFAWPLRLRSVPGRGSIFSVTVPRAPALAEAPIEATQAAPIEPFSDIARVWVVDDDPLIRDATARVVRGWGLTVRTASGGDELWAGLEHEPPVRRTFVLLDQRLGEGADGLTLATELRRRYRDDVALLLVTGEQDEAVAIRAADAEVHLLRKPVKPIRLRAALTAR
jgi:signal transduction histidine kinase/CheY-like chemotaxis protein